MTAYAFEALDADGKTIKDIVDAESAKSARSALRARGLAPLSVVPAVADAWAEGAAGGGSILQMRLFAARVFSPTSLIIWTRQLAGHLRPQAHDLV